MPDKNAEVVLITIRHGRNQAAVLVQANGRRQAIAALQDGCAVGKSLMSAIKRPFSFRQAENGKSLPYSKTAAPLTIALMPAWRLRHLCMAFSKHRTSWQERSLTVRLPTDMEKNPKSRHPGLAEKQVVTVCQWNKPGSADGSPASCGHPVCISSLIQIR